MTSTRLSAEQAIEQIAAGRQVILVDDEDRENEGDLCMAAVKATADDINFMARFGRGLVCLTLTQARIAKLGLARMSQHNQSRFGTNFYVSIEAREGVTTGISAADRATTIQAAVAEDATPQSIVTPGHVFPIGAVPGGVLVRAGQTEGSVDLARLAGLEPAGVICEIMKDDGTMARRPDLELFAKEHGLGIVTIEQLINYRLRREEQITDAVVTTVQLPNCKNSCELHIFESSVGGASYYAFVFGGRGELARASDNGGALVRMHRATLLADVFGIGRSKNQIALARIDREGVGVFVYVVPQQTDGATELARITRPPKLADEPPGALRDFGLGAQVLARLGLKKIRLMTDNPRRIVGLQGFGLTIAESVSLEP